MTSTHAPSAARRHRILIAESGTGYGGSAKYLKELVNALDRARYAVAVAAAGEGPLIKAMQAEGVPVGAYPAWRFPWGLPDEKPVVAEEDDPWRDAAPDPTPDAPIASRPSPRAGRYLLYALGGGAQLVVMVPAIAAWLAWRRIRLVHLNNEVLSHLPLLLAAKLAGCRVICHLHGWRPLTRSERWVVGCVDEFVAISEAGSRYYGEQVGRQVTAVPNGLKLDGHLGNLDARRARLRSTLGLLPEAKVLTLIGRLVPWKGHEVFLRALAACAKRSPNVTGLIVGHDPSPDGQYLKRLQALAHDLGLARRVRFVPWQRDVLSVYAASDLIIHASVQPEPFGLVLVEAMAVGKPVIATRGGGVTDILIDQESGLLTEPGDAEGLARAMQRMVDDPALAGRLAAQGRARALERFTMARNAAQIMAIYDKWLTP